MQKASPKSPKPEALKLEYAPWLDDPDEPDRMTDAEMDQMVERIAAMFPDLVKKP